MRDTLRSVLALVLSGLMILLPAMQARGQEQSKPAPAVPTTTLRGHLQEHYVELFELAPTLHYSTAEIEKQRAAFAKGKNICVSRFKDHAKKYGKQIEETQKNLKATTSKVNDAQRKQIHCKIQNLEFLKGEADVLSGHAIPTAYDNLNAKLDVIEKWPALYQQTQQEIATESYLKRRWGNVKDIGFREIAAGQ